MPTCVRFLSLLLAVTALAGATYEVGPGQALATIGAVPWESLNAGDTVRIHWQATPYREKWVINRTGTAVAPITVTGVPGPGGARPVISGDGATTRSQLDYWNRQRSVIKVGGSSVPSNAQATWIVIENLDIASARPAYSYTNRTGATETYADNAASIHIEAADHVTIRNCIIRDSSNGLFVTYSPSSNILVTGCSIHGNGRDGSFLEHNVYTEADGITFEYNRFGPLRAGCLGNNLKDRSSGTVVRCNWIEGGNRQIDLVDGGHFSDAAYRTTHVYGNILIEPDGHGNRQIIHYGGDSGDTSKYRKGTLHLYHNTIVSTRTDRTTLLRLSSIDEHCDARNNLIYVSAAGSTLELLSDAGTVNLTGNWLKTGFANSFFGTGTVTAAGNITGTAPGFVNGAGQDFHLATGSACIAAAAALAPAVLPTHDVVRQYLSHQQSEARADVQDIGAFARTGAVANAAPTVSAATATPDTVIASTTALAATATDDAGEAALTYTWSASPATVTFSPNGTNTAKASTATFSAAGSYVLTVTVRDAAGLAATRTIAVTVQQTPTSLLVSPATTTIAPGTGASFAATLRDQFSASIASPTIAWTVSGGGTIDETGLFTASATADGSFQIHATSSGRTGTATVLIHPEPPVAVAAAAKDTSGAGGCGLGGGFSLLLGLAMLGRWMRLDRGHPVKGAADDA